MARVARKTKKDAIYHIIIKGCTESPLFRDTNDYRYFLSIVTDRVERQDFAVICYCILPDHAHIVCKELKAQPGAFMKAISVRYALYYNSRYNRRGPVFAGRFKSEIVEDDDQLKRLCRFVLQDPVRLGLSVGAVNYPHSSANTYIVPSGPLVDTSILLNLFDANQSEAKTRLLKYLENRSAEWFTDENAAPKLKIQRRLDIERRCWRVLSSEFGIVPSDLATMDENTKRSAIAALRLEGATIHQIMTLTGCSYYTVQKVTSSLNYDDGATK